MILVAGGAGYIGSHAVRELVRHGRRVVVLDNFSRGHRAAVAAEAAVVEADLEDRAALGRVFREHPVTLVMHFAAHSIVPESVQNPVLAFRNVREALNLLEAMLVAGVNQFVFSSSAAVYGEPEAVPITEGHPLRPVNPYGASKAWVEAMCAELRRAQGLRYVSLRYFNAAGACREGSLGEDHHPETHLIPLVLQAALGRREAVDIYGGDFPTPDGTAVRDYVHVTDLAEAHCLAMEALEKGRIAGEIYNLGSGTGYSVLEVLRTAREVTGREIPVRTCPRRPGDPAMLVAGAARIKRELGWSARHSSLHNIIATAWEWHRTHPAGYI